MGNLMSGLAESKVFENLKFRQKCENCNHLLKVKKFRIRHPDQLTLIIYCRNCGDHYTELYRIGGIEYKGGYKQL